ncbi:MAG: HupE/UreJ family protein [Saprospiraceae bacterium]
MYSTYKIILITCLCFFSVIAPLLLNAHAPDQSYVFLRVYESSITGRIEITTDDLNKALNLNLKRGKTIEDFTPFIPQIQSYLLGKVSFASDTSDYTMHFTESDIMVQGDLGDYLLFNFELGNLSQVPDVINIKYNVLFDNDPKHNGLLVIEYNWKAGVFDNEALVSLIFNPSNDSQQLKLTEGTIFQGFKAMIKMGMHHIWIGIDHILFLLALVLPSVMRRDPSIVSEQKAKPYPSFFPFAKAMQQWLPVGPFRPAFIYVAVMVTGFTIAHTITLSLAALGLVNLPSRLVESVIAISIALAAFHNIRPLVKKDWIIAFGFGLFHGFGFAGILRDIGLKGEFLGLSLFGFNIGVEIGQVAIICLIFPVLYLLRRLKLYPLFLIYSSILLILISLYWFTERCFDIDLHGGKWIIDTLNAIGL